MNANQHADNTQLAAVLRHPRDHNRSTISMHDLTRHTYKHTHTHGCKDTPVKTGF